MKHERYRKGACCCCVCLVAGVSEVGEPEPDFEMYRPGAYLRGTAEQSDVGTRCCLASKRQSRRQKRRFFSLFLGLIKDAYLTWFFPFVKVTASIPQFPPVILSTGAYCSDVLYLLSPTTKEAAATVTCCLCLWAFGLCLVGFRCSCSVPSNLEQKGLQVPS